MKIQSRFTHAGLRGCHACGSTEVEAVCHHCGRPLCRQHAAPAPRHAPSVEFAGFGLECIAGDGNPPPMHCAECDHLVREPSMRLAVVGLLVAAAGAAVMLFRPGLGVPVLLAGVALAAYGLWRRQADRAEQRRRRPRFPACGVELAVTGSTQCEGTFEIGTDGAVRSEFRPAEGNLRLEVRFLEEEVRRIRDGLEAGASGIGVHAGFLLPVAGAALRLAGAETAANGAIPLAFDLARDELSNAVDDEVKVRREVAMAARPAAAVPEFGGFSVVAGIEPGSQRSSLVMHFILDGGGGVSGVRQLNSLEVAVPRAWGRIVGIEPSEATLAEGQRTEDGRPEPCWIVRIPSRPVNQDGNPLPVKLRFSSPVEPGQWITGELLAALGPAEGGVAGRSFQAWGAARDLAPWKVSSSLRLRFRLSTTPFRYQSIRVKPDSGGQVDHGTRRAAGADPSALRFPGVVPSHETVIEFARRLASTSDLYLRMLAELHPETGQTKGERVRRWKLAGRGYRGLVPIDFEMLLRGSEHTADAAASHTTVEISVRG
ncbi:MAG: hypothetical protein ACKOET_02555, partial [Verrucomicrobiota bacterium]